MKPNQIRGELMIRGAKVSSIAKQLGVSSPFVSQVISGVRKTEYVRKAIAEALKKPVSDVWPDSNREIIEPHIARTGQGRRE